MADTSYEIFRKAHYGEQLLEASKKMVGKAIIHVEWIQQYDGYPSGVRLTFSDRTTAEFGTWADYADDMGMDVKVADKEVEYPDWNEFIGPAKPPMTPAEKEAYIESLGAFQRVLYDNYAKVVADQLNDNTRLLYGWVEDEKEVSD